MVKVYPNHQRDPGSIPGRRTPTPSWGRMARVVGVAAATDHVGQAEGDDAGTIQNFSSLSRQLQNMPPVYGFLERGSWGDLGGAAQQGAGRG